MDDLQRAALHRVFPIELRGDTLIVTPAGDASGFSGTQFHAELNTVVKLVERPNILKLIVDLSHSNYFGSEMIGAINMLGTRTREHGGYFAVCEASPDMRAGLAMLNLDDHWMLFPTRKQALQAIGGGTAGRTIRIAAGVAVALLILVSAVTAALLMSGRDRRPDHYEFLTARWTEFESFRASGPTKPQWKVFADESKRKLRPVLADLDARSRQNDAISQELLLAGRQFEQILDFYAADEKSLIANDAALAGGRGMRPDESMFRAHMEAARQKLGEATALPPSAEPPLPDNPSPAAAPADANDGPTFSGEQR